MFLEPLTLNLCVPPGNAFAFFPQPADVGTAIPDEKGCGVLTKRLVSGWRIRIETTGKKEVLHKAFCVFSLLTACGMPRNIVALDKTRLAIEPVVPELTASNQVIGTSHGVSFGPGLSHFCRIVTKSFLAPEGTGEGK